MHSRLARSRVACAFQMDTRMVVAMQASARRLVKINAAGMQFHPDGSDALQEAQGCHRDAVGTARKDLSEEVKENKDAQTHFLKPTASASSRRSDLRWPRRKLLVELDMIDVRCCWWGMRSIAMVR